MPTWQAVARGRAHPTAEEIRETWLARALRERRRAKFAADTRRWIAEGCPPPIASSWVPSVYRTVPDD